MILIVSLVIMTQFGLIFWFKTGIVLLFFAGDASPCIKKNHDFKKGAY
jgi:hypothetical protein